MKGTTVVGTRLHWQSHSQHERIDVDKLLRQVREFCTRAATYADGGILIAVGLPAATAAMITGATSAPLDPKAPDTTNVFVDSVHEFMAELQNEAATGAIAGTVEIIPMLYWGKFVPALNALVGTAADHFPDADTLLLQSLEIQVDAAGVALLRSNFDPEQDLVVGTALPGHVFQTDPAVQPLELSGLTSPWNTLALWNLQQLTKIGFALMGDALRLEVESVGPAGGDEEVSTISMYQQLFANTAAPTKAKLIRVPGVVWQVADFKDPERVAWHTMKMRSKKQRTAAQMAHFGGVAPGRVYHIETTFADGQNTDIHGTPLEAKGSARQTTLRRMNLGHGNQARAASLRKEATRRWLVKDELVFLLLHYQVVGVPVLHSLQLRPPSGSLLFYKTTDVADYKKDGWHWQKRKDKNGRVREDRAKLVINREVIILGTYVHSAETSTFHRRIYSVRDSKESIVLVHYFDEVNKEAVGDQLAYQGTKSNHSKNEGVKRSLPASKITTSTDLVSSGRQPTPPKPSSSEETVESIMKNCFEVDFEPLAASAQNSSNSVSDLDLLLLRDSAMDGISTGFGDEELFSDFAPATSPEKRVSGLGGQQTFELAEISDFSPDWDFGDGGAKVLICLATKLPERMAQDPMKLFVQFGGKQVRAEKVSNTVLRCTAPSSRGLGSVDIYVCQWSGSPHQSSIQLSHKKQFTYRSRYQVSPSLVGEIVKENYGSAKESIDPLELAAPSPAQGMLGTGKRGRSPTVHSRAVIDNKRGEDRLTGSNRNLSSYVESDLDERQCKIRVVERLSEFHQVIRTRVAEPAANSSFAFDPRSTRGDNGMLSETENGPSSPARAQSTDGVARHEQQSSQQLSQSSGSFDPPSTLVSSNGRQIALDDCTIESLSDNDLEQLSEKLLERVVHQLVTVAHTSEELLEELNSLDETGLSLLHYVSFYNYSQLVPVLVAHGARINQQSTQGQTALHLAAGCGHNEVVDGLLQSGADLRVHDFDGLTAADRAEKSGHADVAAKLRHHMGGDVAEDLEADDEIYGFGGSPMEIDDAPTPYMDAGDMGLLESYDDAGLSPRLARSHSNSCESPCEESLSSKSTSYVGENQEHNRKLLLGAFSTMSLHDKCALSLSISRDSVGHPTRRRDSSVGEEILNSPSTSSTGTSAGFGSSPASMVGMVGIDSNLVGSRLLLSGGENDSDVQSVIAEDEEGLTKLQAAMELMGPEERQSLEDEVTVLQHGIRAWLLKRNCKNMREATKQLCEATQSIQDQQKQHEAAEHRSVLSERERAAVTVQAATRSMLARRSYLQTKHVAIKFQAATRGVLCRKNFARMKAHALASLVIQRNVREWWNKQPAASRPGSLDKNIADEEDATTEENAPMPSPAYESHQQPTII